jgi:hypothetical protein
VTKSTPLILRFTFGHSCRAGISPPTELSFDTLAELGADYASQHMQQI